LIARFYASVVKLQSRIKRRAAEAELLKLVVSEQWTDAEVKQRHIGHVLEALIKYDSQNLKLMRELVPLLAAHAHADPEDAALLFSLLAESELPKNPALIADFAKIMIEHRDLYGEYGAMQPLQAMQTMLWRARKDASWSHEISERLSEADFTTLKVEAAVGGRNQISALLALAALTRTNSKFSEAATKILARPDSSSETKVAAAGFLIMNAKDKKRAVEFLSETVQKKTETPKTQEEATDTKALARYLLLAGIKDGKIKVSFSVRTALWRQNAGEACELLLSAAYRALGGH
jgi:hypothetical protein